MIRFLPYRAEFEQGIKELFRIPVSGNISLALEREPNYYTGACVQSEKPEVYVCYDDVKKKLWAVMNIGVRRLWYNGEVVEVRYMSDLRIHPDKQNGPLFLLLIKHYQSITAKEVLPAQTVVFADNHKMISLINKASQKAISTIPVYHYMGRLETYMLNFKSQKRKSNHIMVRKAKASDIETMQAFFDLESAKLNYYPYYNFAELEGPYYNGIRLEDYFLAFKSDKLVGICGVWDQKSFKQTRILGYSQKYKLFKPIYNLASRILGGQKLPDSGTVLKYLNLHCILVQDHDTAIFSDLLLNIKLEFKSQNYDYLLCGLSENDPLAKVFKVNKPTRKIYGNYYCVNDGEAISAELYQKHFYLEASRI